VNLDEQIHDVALFYFYSLLDRGKARYATIETIRRIRQMKKKKNIPEGEMASLVVSETLKGWEKTQSLHPSRLPAGVAAEHWEVPRRLDLGAWRQFHKSSDRDEFLALIWSQILGFTDDEISQGLNVSTGTVRHRISRGLRGLSAALNPDRYDD